MNSIQKLEKEQNSWNEHIGRFVDQWMIERCVWGSLAPAHRTGAADLHRDFLAWCHERSLPSLSIRAFGALLSQRGVRRLKDRNGRIQRWPIRFTTAGDRAVRAGPAAPSWADAGGLGG